MNINVDLADPSCILVPHRNLEELKAHDAYIRDKVARRKQKIIEQWWTSWRIDSPIY